MKIQNAMLQAHVILQATVTSVDKTKPWFFYECTCCQNKIRMENDIYCCLNCKRRLPHPPKRFSTTIIASDHSGELKIQLEDREVCTLTGKRAKEVFLEVKISFKLQ